jgi:hypothetical protein
MYAKGFILDRNLVAKLAKVESETDPKVAAYIHSIISGLNREGYKFIGGVFRPPQPGQRAEFGDKRLEMAIVLETGDDEAMLRSKELPPLDATIAAAQPHVLIGPDVWELWE